MTAPGDARTSMDAIDLDSRTAALVRFAGVVAQGDPASLRAEIARLLAAEVPIVWVEELLLQSVLMVGYPLAFAATAAWRAESGVSSPAADPDTAAGPEGWRERGERTCARIYGENYEKLRRNVRALHPALDAWMVTEGYGRTLSRPGLDLVRRELCTIAQTAVQRAGPQLHSHLRGARNAGAGDGMIAGALAAIAPLLDEAGRALLSDTWAAVRRAPAERG